MEKSRLTITDIAEQAGVAKSTVSRYLNGGQVSKKTKAKIKQVIDATNYEPNTFAQSLKAKRTRMIGVVAPTLDSLVTSAVLMAIERELKRQGYFMLIVSTSKQIEEEIEALEQLARQKVDGIILISTQITAELDEMIASIDIPVLIVGQESSRWSSIVNDDYEAGYHIGRYVAESGHREVVYLGVSEEDQAVGQKRKAGVIEGLMTKDVAIRSYVTDFTYEAAYELCQSLLVQHSFTAVVCATDNIAYGVIRAMHEAGRSIPNDLSVTGFGGYYFSEILNPPLTTIRYRNEEVGKKAAQAMIRLACGQDVPRLQMSGFDFITGASVKQSKKS